MKPKRINIGRVPIDVVRLDEVVDAIDELIQRREGGTVCTPNVDHVVLCEHNERFRAAYAAASLSVVDGVPVLWASRLLGCPLPMKISGSDLVIPLLKRARDRGYRIYFLGAEPGVADKARRNLEAELPGIRIVGVDSPWIDIDGDCGSVIERVNQAAPDIVLVALGAPKQDIFSHENRSKLAPAVLLGIGASLDFIAGVRQRAPSWISDFGLEWAFRLVLEPRRLAYRYLVRDPEFVRIVWRQWRQSRKNAV